MLGRFARGLDNRFIMLYHLQLEKLGPPFPPILVGPAGLFVLNLSHAKGFYRAKESSWWKIEKNTQKYTPAHPNLIKQSQDYARQLATILETHGKTHPEITPILILANPGGNVETTNPAVRIVRMDGVESLMAGMLKGDDVLQPNEIAYLSDSLEVMANPEKAIPMGEGEDFFGRDLYVPEKKALPKLPSMPTEIPLESVEKKMQFSNKQWLIVAVLLGLTIIVLLIAIFYALSG